MNYLLPKFEELLPITEKNKTFSDCGFDVTFDELSFEKKLKVVNDLIRQSILTNPCPDPKTDTETLIGDCHTATLASIEYLKYLNIGKNHRYVMARKRNYDPEDVTTKHAMLLVDDNDGNTYQYDAAPYVGYKYGYVERIDENRFYEEYDVLCESKLELLYIIRELIFKHSKKQLNREEIPYYEYVLNEGLKYPILKGYISCCYNLLSTYMGDDLKRMEMIKKAISLNPYDKRNINNIEYKNKLIMNQINLWENELNILLKNGENLKRQLELAQNIVQERKLIDISLEKYLNIDGINIRISHISPRFFMENGLNVIMIKPSAYYLGVRGTIRERFLDRGNGAIDEYFTNLAKPTIEAGLIPALFSHSMGIDYKRSLNGTADVILLKKSVEELQMIKKTLRNELGKTIINRDVTWSDGQKILWHPFVTNLIHATDNPSESNLHYLIGYPEHQLMTRFMYPNPNLEKVKIK